jgi:hypothetical protein
MFSLKKSKERRFGQLSRLVNYGGFSNPRTGIHAGSKPALGYRLSFGSLPLTAGSSDFARGLVEGQHGQKGVWAISCGSLGKRKR